MKKCNICKTEKPLTEFFNLKKSLDGKQPKCKECSKKQVKEYYKNNPGKQKEYEDRRYKKNKERVLEQRRNYYLRNSEKIKQRRKDWYKENKNTSKNWILKTKYGITLDRYNSLLKEQDGCCKICNKPVADDKQQLAVDHCHKTGKVRGLLCSICNLMLGYAEDNINTLQSAITYLETTNGI